ncbi:reverse transcriptase family protein [Actinocrispum sp. NPDC049592]|uniref:reverse transcriptase family protein n=1 Tax=Actinocrispum sp. NPDC049592 TaxID=3154835 RepID=UPI00343A120C
MSAEHGAPRAAVRVADVGARGWREQESFRVAALALAGPWRRPEIAGRLVDLYPDPAAAETMADLLVQHSPTRPFGDPADLARQIMAFPVALQESPPERKWWPRVPQWTSTTDLAALLDLTPSEVDWMADARGWNRHAAGKIRHYKNRWMTTSTGGLRLIEAPKPRLAEAQRRIARHLIAALPVHEAAHGFRTGRSAHTYAQPHAGKAFVVRMDLEGFFAAVTGARVRALLKSAGYPEPVAARLAGLLTTRTPKDVLIEAPPSAGDPDVRRRLLNHLAYQHLPQGAPSSPALANAVAHRLDARLAGLARSLGADYTRYADDLAFSGPQTLPLHRLLPGVRRIAADEGFRVRPDKTRIAAAHQRQRLTGLVVNATPTVSRAEFDALKALLHNCARTGPEAQNRNGHHDFQAHVRGRIEWVAAGHPGRGAKLRFLYERVSW